MSIIQTVSNKGKLFLLISFHIEFSQSNNKSFDPERCYKEPLKYLKGSQSEVLTEVTKSVSIIYRIQKKSRIELIIVTIIYKIGINSKN